MSARTTLLAMIAASILAFSSSALGAESGPPSDRDARSASVWQPRTKSVAVFKNGLGFFVRQAAVTPHQGWCLAKEIPPAKFGTLAIYAARQDEFVDVVGSGPGEIVEFDGVDVGKSLETVHKRLEAALLLNVEFTYRHHGAERTAAGKLVSLGPDFAVLEGEGSSFAVPVKGILKMQVFDLPLRIHVARDGGEDRAAGPTEIGMAYLREGITWIPEYSLVVHDDQTAELTLRGTLVNEAEDLVHCDVNFVVGVPHFTHTGYLAPLAVRQALRTLGAAVAPPGLQSQISNRAAIASNSSTANPFNRDRRGAPGRRTCGPHRRRPGRHPGQSAPARNGRRQRLHRVHQERPHRAARRTGHRHVARQADQLLSHLSLVAARGNPALPRVAERHRQRVDDRALLGIEQRSAAGRRLVALHAARRRCEIPLTTSVNVAHARQEEETDRKFKVLLPAKDVSLDLVTLGGVLKLENFEQREVDVVITNPVPGRPISASDGGVTRVDPTRLKLVERSGSIRWTLKIPPGESKMLKYQYERYVPSN